MTRQFVSNYEYFSGYQQAKPLEQQISILRRYWPKLKPGKKIIKLERRPNAPNEGTFTVVRWQALAPSYNEALKEVFKAIKKQRKGKFYNWREGKLGERHLRQHQHTIRVFQMLADQQKDSDILVVVAQFGILHRGLSVQTARWAFISNEFGLGALEVGCMLLTHPKRLHDYDDLWIDCAGDEYALNGNGRFNHAPCFFFHGGEVGFNVTWISGPGRGYGSASGFLPIK